jgi:hypothetical protein
VVLDEVAELATAQGWQVQRRPERPNHLRWITPAGKWVCGTDTRFVSDDASVVRLLHILHGLGPRDAVEEVLSRHDIRTRDGRRYDLVAALRRNPEVPVDYRRPRVTG